MKKFKLHSKYKPSGDQPEAIAQLVEGLEEKQDYQVLLGVTGSGKTFTMANVIEKINVPTLVLAPNKTLAAQLFQEFRELFPENAVEYFVSYYDYYLPESYSPTTDTYIEKETSINEQIDRMRHRATRALLERRDCLIVASVSCIYGLGSPEFYSSMIIRLHVDMEIEREELIRRLVELQYLRKDYEFTRGSFRVRGETIDIFPSDEEKFAIRVLFFGDTIEKLVFIDPLWGDEKNEIEHINIFPGSHYVAPPVVFERAIKSIRKELNATLKDFYKRGKELEAQKLEQRTNFDIEMMKETGFCAGIENYSRHFDNREPGQPPWTLLHYFPDDFVIFIDESHIALPQVKGMFRGDQARKVNLIEYGFRLPCAKDNRPLCFEEFDKVVKRVVCVSATPGTFELEQANGVVVEQIIRPTGLLDPEIIMKPSKYQMDELMGMIRERIEKNERTLVVTLTKKMSEKLTEFLTAQNIKVKYIHSDINTLERVRILRELRKGEFDVLVGINLLREGIDLPEVSLVAILDADKEGFLRSESALIQIIGRAARNSCGQVVMFCDTQTDSIKNAVAETMRRRKIQTEYNTAHGITPTTISKPLPKTLEQLYKFDDTTQSTAQMPDGFEDAQQMHDKKELARYVKKLKTQMSVAAKNFDFENAAKLRDRIKYLEELEMEF